MIKAIIRDENHFYSAHVLKTWTWYPRYHNYCFSLEVATLWLGGSEEEQRETFPFLLDYDGKFTVAGFYQKKNKPEKEKVYCWAR